MKESNLRSPLIRREPYHWTKRASVGVAGFEPAPRPILSWPALPVRYTPVLPEGFEPSLPGFEPGASTDWARGALGEVGFEPTGIRKEGAFTVRCSHLGHVSPVINIFPSLANLFVKRHYIVWSNLPFVKQPVTIWTNVRQIRMVICVFNLASSNVVKVSMSFTPSTSRATDS